MTRIKTNRSIRTTCNASTIIVSPVAFSASRFLAECRARRGNFAASRFRPRRRHVSPAHDGPSDIPRLSTYLPTYLPTYYLPTRRRGSHLRKRGRQYPVWFDATVRHPGELFSHKTKKPIPRVRCPSPSPCRPVPSSIFPRFFAARSLARTPARRRDPPFLSFSPFLRSRRAKLLREEVTRAWTGARVAGRGGGLRGHRRFQDGHCYATAVVIAAAVRINPISGELQLPFNVAEPNTRPLHAREKI